MALLMLTVLAVVEVPDDHVESLLQDERPCGFTLTADDGSTHRVLRTHSIYEPYEQDDAS